MKKPYIPKLAENNVRTGFFEPWQFDALLPKLPDELRSPMTFAYWTGWRMYSQVLALTWSQVNLYADIVRLLPGTTKNREGRVFFLPPELKSLLEQQWAEHLKSSPECP